MGGDDKDQTMNTGNWITIVVFGLGVVLAVYGFIYRMDRRVASVEGRCENQQAVLDTISSMNSRLDKVAADNETFWRILGPSLADIIHSPKAVDRDALVDKLVSGHITAAECVVLIGLLREAIGSDRWTGDKRVAGALLMARTTSKLHDLEAAEGIRRRV